MNTPKNENAEALTGAEEETAVTKGRLVIRVRSALTAGLKSVAEDCTSNCDCSSKCNCSSHGLKA